MGSLVTLHFNMQYFLFKSFPFVLILLPSLKKTLDKVYFETIRKGLKNCLEILFRKEGTFLNHLKNQVL